jgi:hypothetical protein
VCLYIYIYIYKTENDKFKQLCVSVM